jgi:hypothetical protein
MDTKRTTGEQITDNSDGFLEKICEKIKEKKRSEMSPLERSWRWGRRF